MHIPIGIYIKLFSLITLCVVLAELNGNSCTAVRRRRTLAWRWSWGHQATWSQASDDDESELIRNVRDRGLTWLNLNMSWKTTSTIDGTFGLTPAVVLTSGISTSCSVVRGSRSWVMDAAWASIHHLQGYALKPSESHKSFGIRVASTNCIHRPSQLCNPTAVWIAYPGFRSASGSGFGLGKQRSLKPNSHCCWCGQKLGFHARGNSGVDSDSDPEKNGAAISVTAPAAPVAPVAPAAYAEVQPEALVERTEAMGDGDSGDMWGSSGWVFEGFPKSSEDLLKLGHWDGCWNCEVGKIWQWQRMVVRKQQGKIDGKVNEAAAKPAERLLMGTVWFS